MESIVSPFGLLRTIKPEELALMLSWRNAPSVRANMYTQHEIQLDEHLAWWERVQSRKDQQYLMFESNNNALGVVAFNGIDPINKNSSWAFYASPDAPNGTGSKMEFLALDHAFDNLNLHKLSCEVLAFNVPVIKLHQKFGFKVEGVFRDQFRNENHFVDIYRLGILAHEWQEFRPKISSKLSRLS